MKTYLPHSFKKIGIAFVILSIIISFVAGIDAFNEGFEAGYNSGRKAGHNFAYGQNLTTLNQDSKITGSDEKIISKELSNRLNILSSLFSFSGFLIYILSKEKFDDEFIQKIRYTSLTQSLVFTWIVVSILIILNSSVKFEGLYILQFQLFTYVLIYNYNKKIKYS